MKRSIWVIAASAGALVLGTGCGNESNQPPPDVSAVELEDVKEQTREAAKSAVEYAKNQRAELEERTTEAVGQLDEELTEARNELAELSDDVSDEARARLEGAIDRAERARKALETEMKDLKQAGSEQWKATQERVSDALEEVDEARREITVSLTDERADEPGAS